MIVAGGAPTTPEVERFLTECFPVTLVDGYGTTEAGGSITVRNRVARPPVIDYKLRDVPELGYYTTDKPYPRGELCVKTELSVPGYFKRPEATAALFDEEGYLRTGDIMEEREPDHLVYVDRRNDVLKLAQGEFVAARGAGQHVRERQQGHPPDLRLRERRARRTSSPSIVPNMEIVERVLGPDPSEAELKALIRAELKQVAEAENLRSFEVPRDFIVEMEPFSHENGLLSSIHKRMRPEPAAQVRRGAGAALHRSRTQAERPADGAARPAQRPERAGQDRQGAGGHAGRRGPRRHAAEQLRRARRRLAWARRRSRRCCRTSSASTCRSTRSSARPATRGSGRGRSRRRSTTASVPADVRPDPRQERPPAQRQGPRHHQLHRRTDRSTIRRWTSLLPSPGPCC